MLSEDEHSDCWYILFADLDSQRTLSKHSPVFSLNQGTGESAGCSHCDSRCFLVQLSHSWIQKCLKRNRAKPWLWTPYLVTVFHINKSPVIAHCSESTREPRLLPQKLMKERRKRGVKEYETKKKSQHGFPSASMKVTTTGLRDNRVIYQ